MMGAIFGETISVSQRVYSAAIHVAILADDFESAYKSATKSIGSPWHPYDNCIADIGGILRRDCKLKLPIVKIRFRS